MRCVDVKCSLNNLNCLLQVKYKWNELLSSHGDHPFKYEVRHSTLRTSHSISVNRAPIELIKVYTSVGQCDNNIIQVGLHENYYKGGPQSHESLDPLLNTAIYSFLYNESLVTVYFTRTAVHNSNHGANHNPHRPVRILDLYHSCWE